MTEHDENTKEIYEARRALAEAQFSEVKTAAAVGAVKRASAGIRTIVERNGYVERFRGLFNDGNAA